MSRRHYSHILSKCLVSALFIFSMIALVACGGGEEDSDSGPAKTATQQTIAAKDATNVGSDPHTVATPVPTPIPPLDMDAAKQQLSVFLSKCIILDTTDIEAVEV